MLLIPDFLRDPEMTRRRRAAQQEDVKRRLQACVPYDPKMPWATELNLQASTYQIDEPMPHIVPFDYMPCQENHFKVEAMKALDAQQVAFSPTRRWAYVRRRLRKGGTLETFSGKRRGTVLFDGDIITPVLTNLRSILGYKILMSLTPLEVLSLRVGTRQAKGHTIVAGLGVGHQLVEVLRRPKVERVTLIEKNQELVDWLLPHILLRMATADEVRKLDVIVGDAWKVLPELTADVALLDIFDGFNNNGEETRFWLRRWPRNIGRIWSWGACLLENVDLPWPWNE